MLLSLQIISYILLGWLTAWAINHAGTVLPQREPVLQLPKCVQCGATTTQNSWASWSILLATVLGQTDCPACGHTRHLTRRYWLVEIGTPLIFGLLAFHYRDVPPLKLWLDLLYSAILILITVTDMEHRLILNKVTFPAIGFAFAALFFTPGYNWFFGLMGGLISFVGALGIYLLFRGGFGYGDVTLSAFLGLILGYPHVVLSLCLGAFLGGFVSAGLLISGRVKFRTFIPYGPFLTITGWLMLIWGAEIWAFYYS